MKTLLIASILITIAPFLQTKAQQKSGFVFASYPEPVLATEDLSNSKIAYADLQVFFRNKQAAKAVLGYTKQNRPVEVYYFPGSGSKRALIIGGMHGSELSSIEIAYQIINRLKKGESNYYDVLIIPALFPDNAFASAMAPAEKRKSNFGRYTNTLMPDPNRQMPCLGTAFHENEPYDHHGRTIENENQYLLQLIQDYRPSRIVNLHAIRDTTKAGIYADPRTDCKGMALGFERDSSLALSIAKYIYDKGGSVPGNHFSCCPTALYYNDPGIAPAGNLQKRNLHGSPLPYNRGYGVSLGGWATTAVCEENVCVREASKLITVEFPGYASSSLITDPVQKKQCFKNVQLYSEAVIVHFLSSLCEE